MSFRPSMDLGRALLFAGVSLSLLTPNLALAQGRRTMPPPRPVPSARTAPSTHSTPVRAKVEMEMRIVYATSANSTVDSRLASLARYLSHLRFTGYQLLDTQKAQVSLGGKANFTVEGGRRVTVNLLGRDENRARVRVVVSASNNKQILDTTMSVNRDGTVIVAGPKYHDGILVLPLTLRY